MAPGLSTMEASAFVLASVFKEAAGRDGNPDKMSKCEFKALIKEQCPHILEAAEKQEGGFNGLFDALDIDQSGDICVTEFSAMVCGFACTFFELLKTCEQQEKQ